MTLDNSFAEVALFFDPSLKGLKAYGPVFRFFRKDSAEVEGQELLSLFTADTVKQLSILIAPPARKSAEIHKRARDGAGNRLRLSSAP